MATKPHPDPELYAAVERAVRSLVSIGQWGSSAFVSLPIFYPSGTAVTVKVEKVAGGFRVSDGGFAYREIEQMGAEHYFGKNATKFAEEIGAVADKRSLIATAAEDHLAATIADIAATTARLAHKITASAGSRGEAEIADHLLERLNAVFGSARVEPRVTIVGASNHAWEVDAIVQLDARQAVFQAVANHHASVYSTAAMFHDLAVRGSPPATVSVVRRKDRLGYLLEILAQAGSVIEDDQADSVYEGATEW